jgi:methylmalonyl-CoA/ethylmalonyl-CoA epimerase
LKDEVDIGRPDFLGATTQVALVVADLRRALDPLVRVGLGPWQIYDVSPENAQLVYKGRPDAFSMKLAVAWQGTLMWEVIQPTGGESIYRDFLDRGASGLHHLLVDCNGIPYQQQREGFERRRFEEVQRGSTFDGNINFVYFDDGDPGSPIFEIASVSAGFVLPPPDEWYPAPPDQG